MKSRMELRGGGQRHLGVSPACAARAVSEVGLLALSGRRKHFSPPLSPEPPALWADSRYLWRRTRSSVFSAVRS